MECDKYFVAPVLAVNKSFIKSKKMKAISNISTFSTGAMKAKAFARALLYYLQWKIRLRKFISGKSDLWGRENDFPEENKFSEWLSSDEAAQYASDNEIQEFERLYGQILAVSNRIYELKNSGDDMAARREFENMQAPSLKLISLLTILPKRRN